jgi:activating signal cointegrator complex subunit 2
MAATLPPFSVLSAKSLVDPNKWDRIVSLLSRDILAICQANQKGFDASAAKTFLSSFFQDAARESLRNLSGHNEELSPSEDILFGRILDLFEKLATSNHSVDFALLQNLAITYGGKHRYLDRVQTMFSKALKSSPTILTEISFKVLPAYSSLLKPNLANDPSSTLSALRRTLYCITCLLRCGSIELCTTFARSMDFMMALATCYGRVLTGLATSLGGIRTHESNRELTWEIDFLEAKIDAMDAFHVLLSKGFLEFLKSSPHSSVEESFFSILLPLLDLDSAPNPPPSVIHFVNQPLLTDYEHAYRLSEMLRNTNPPMKDESMVDYVATALKATKVVGISDPPGGLSLLLVPRKSSPSHGSRVDKGKAKEIVRAVSISQVPVELS